MNTARILGFVAAALPLLGLGGCLGGCSANHWGGDTAGQRPGVSLRGRSLWGPAKLEVTSDCSATLDKLEYGSLKLENARFGQSAAAVVAVEPAKLEAIARVQEAQVAYVGALLTGIRDIVHEVVPVLKLLAMGNFVDTSSGIQMTLPNGLSFGQTTARNASELRALLADALHSVESVSELPRAPPATQPVIREP